MNSTAFGQTSSGGLSVTTNSFSYQNQICQTANFIKVLDVDFENYYTSPDDSVMIDRVYLSSWSHPFTLGDSLFGYIGGRLVFKEKFSSGNLMVYLNKWIKAGSKLNVEVYCKTFSVSSRTEMYVRLDWATYYNGSWSNSVWPNLQSPWFYTYDCTQPKLSDNGRIQLPNQVCYDNLGDTLTVSSFDVKNPNKDTLVLNGYSFKIDYGCSWCASTDSVILYDDKYKIISSARVYNNRFKLLFNLKIAGSKTVRFNLAYMQSSRGNLQYSYIDSVFWVFDKKSRSSDIWFNFNSQPQLQDCKPSIKLGFNVSKRSSVLCTGDQINLWPEWVNFFNPVKKHEYFVNGKLIDVSYDKISYDYFSIPVIYPVTKIVIRVTDTTGRFASDSVVLYSQKAPMPKMYASSTSMCHGEYVTLSCDTVGLDKWAWNGETPSNKVKIKNTVFTGGYHNFFAIARNGCVADTSVNVYEIPAQSKPTIISNDWVVGSSVKADSFSWSKYNDTTKSWINISNSNKMFINRTDKGFYTVKAWNSGGCSAESDMVFHNGYVTKDSLPHVKLFFTASKPGTSFCTSDKIVATRKILETVYPITNEEWFLNGSKISFSKKQLFDGMEYFVPMNTGTVKVKVIVTDKVGKTAVDSFTLTINKSPKSIITASSNKMCAGNGVTITADTTGLSKWAWGNDKPSKYTNKLTVYEGGSYMFTAIAQNGCSADTTVILTKISAQTKPVGLSNDWTIGSSVKADSFAWYKLNDTTSKLERIINSNKMFMRELRKGYYAVEVFNKNGCSQMSDNFFHNGWILKDSVPYVKLLITSENSSLRFCKDEKVTVTRKITDPTSPTVSEQWFWNGKKIPLTKNQMFDGMEYRVPLNASIVILKVVVTDKAGKVASDSIVITVNKTPKALVKLSSNTFCSGGNVTLIADTAGIAKYAWNSDKLSVYPTKLSITESGSYRFTVVSKDGCVADTTVMVTKLQTPDRPTGLSNDWTIGSSLNAENFVWYRMNDTTAKFEVIKNSNKQFLRELRKGYYYVDIFNNNGCSNGSEVFYHKGYIITDSMPHVKLRITAPKPGTKFCNSDKIIAGRQILETAFPTAQEEWFLNGTKIPFTKSQTFDAMEYPVPMNVGNAKLKIVVTDKIGKTASDSFEFTVLPKPRIILDHPSTKVCYGGTANICIDTAKLLKWSFNGVPSKNPKNNFQVFESSMQSISITSIGGCVADTSFNVVMYPNQERLIINSTDSLLWVNQKAYEVEWFLESVSIGYDDQVIQSKKSGFYQAIATSQFGCTSTSDLYYFKYIQPKTPVAPKDSTDVKIGSENPSIVFCEGEFNPTLTLVNVKKEDISNVEWFVENTSVFSCKDIQLCGLIPRYLWLTPGARTIIVKVVLLNKSVESDTVYVTVVGPQKTKLSVTGNLTECSGRTVVVNVQNNSNYKSVTWSNGSNGKNITLLDPNGSFFATTIDYNGCVANTDTVMLKTLILPKPNLSVSGCKLFADINWQQGGSWEWSYSNKMTNTSEPEITTLASKAWWKVRYSYAGCYSDYSNAVFVECISAGVSNVNQKLGFSVYPNPVVDQFTIESNFESGEAQLIDMQGRVVRTFTVEYGSNTIYREGLAAGVYSIIFNGDATRIVFQ